MATATKAKATRSFSVAGLKAPHVSMNMDAPRENPTMIWNKHCFYGVALSTPQAHLAIVNTNYGHKCLVRCF